MARKSISLLLSMFIMTLFVMTPFAAFAETSTQTNIVFGDVHFSTGGVGIEGKAIPGTTQIKASVNVSNPIGNGETFTLLLAVYDKYNRLVKVVTGDEEIPTAQEETYTISIDGFVADEDTKAKLFFVDKLNILRPLRDTKDLSFGFPTADNYYIAIAAEETLDATTVKKDNFTLSSGGQTIDAVKDVYYLPTQNEVRIYLTEDIKDITSQLNVTSSGVKDVDGQGVTLAAQAYFTPESKCDLYDISIANVNFKVNGAPLYTQPKEGTCTITVKVINSALSSKSGTLRVYTKNIEGQYRELNNGGESVSIASGAEKESSYQVSLSLGEVVYAEIIK